MVHAVISAHVNASAERVRELYADPSQWPRLFPATIRGAQVLRREEDTTMVEVDHIEGKVLNLLHRVSATRLVLDEFKRRYDATFTHEFIPEPGGMRFTVSADVRLKGPYRLLAPVAKPLVLARMRRYVVEPLKAAAERAVDEVGASPRA